MAAQFDTSSRRTLEAGGWQVGAEVAHRRETRFGVAAFAKVRADGSWSVAIKRATLAQGQDSHPCSAAMDANEILWAWRDGRKASDHLGGKLTDEGRAVL